MTNESKIAPVYVTSDLAFITGEETKDLTQWLLTNFQFVVRGLVFQLSQDRGFADPGDLHLETRGLADGTLKFEKDDVVKVKVLPAYTTMFVSRGRYLAFAQQYERASAAFEQALALDPGLEVARKGLSDSRRTLRTQ